MRPEMANPPEMELGLRYDRTMIALHWLTAGLVVVLWVIAQIIDDWTGQARVNVRSIHITLGVVLVAGSYCPGRVAVRDGPRAARSGCRRSADDRPADARAPLHAAGDHRAVGIGQSLGARG